jgi:integrase
MEQHNKTRYINIGKPIVKKPVKHSKDNALEVHVQKELIEAIKTLDIKEETKFRYRVLIALIMEGGLRISEAIQTRLSWITETDDGITLNIPEKDRDHRNLKRDWKPKTVQGIREVIFLDDKVGSLIKSYLISNKGGLGFSRQQAGKIVKMLGEKINKPKLHPHALRSTYANNLVYSGVNASTLMYFMGWARLETAMNYFKTSKIAARKDLLEKMKSKDGGF